MAILLIQGFIKQHFPNIETAEIEAGSQLCSDQQEESLTNPLSLPICQDIEISQQEEAVQYTCTVCNQEFKQKQLLTKHSKLVHKEGLFILQEFGLEFYILSYKTRFRPTLSDTHGVIQEDRDRFPILTIFLLSLE